MTFRPPLARVFNLTAFVCLLASAQAAAQTRPAGGALEARVRELVAASGAETVAVAFRDLQTGRELLVNGRVSFHAASTMKVPVMLEVYRAARAGRLRLDERLPVRNEFKSIADGSAFSVAPEDDSERTLYAKVGATETVRELMRLMVTESSNLATNILIERVTPARVRELCRRLGARDMRVLRGVEDGKAYARGMNNTTTARDLLLLLRAIAEGRAVSAEASREVADVLAAQKFNEGIPAGLPRTASSPTSRAPSTKT
ncbi:MAG: class A beta-lactamase-related serine hydrolase [Acidobacteria bacterium]|nr:class A beta-lactamase-related serine hydrolase [Acidobacteriota bacterium]